ncbi:MAG: hypothetical protein KC478_07910 [Bacteriovoracaceae bacterium]|nr:hypothetical protein [Bacteriovoracaceae bacterium]
MENSIYEIAKEFSAQSHGSTDFFKERCFVRGSNDEEFVPLAYLLKKLDNVESKRDLCSMGFVSSSLDFLELKAFEGWWQNQFNKKLLQKDKKDITIIHLPDTKKIFDAVEIVNQVYQILKDHKVLVNGKNLPIQLGEWYSKSIFGLRQKKTSSQRGFDFFTEDEKKVEVKIHWQNTTSPKGVKLKKSLVEMSDYVIIMYVAKNFMIRDILLLDSDFVIRKFGGKGHTLFLKDQDVSGYFFSKSDKHYGKIVNQSALLKFASPNFAMKLDEKLSKNQ